MLDQDLVCGDSASKSEVLSSTKEGFVICLADRGRWEVPDTLAMPREHSLLCGVGVAAARSGDGVTALPDQEKNLFCLTQASVPRGLSEVSLAA